MLDEPRRRERYQETEKKSMFKKFLHGIAFSLIYFFLVLLWVAITTGLLFLGYLIGALLALFLLFVFVGSTNKIIMRTIWNVECTDSLLSLFGHGLTLSIIMAIVGFPLLVLDGYLMTYHYNVYALWIPTYFVINAIIFGHIAYGVGQDFRELSIGDRPRRTRPISYGKRIIHTECPYCGALDPYLEEDISEDNKAICQECGVTLKVPKETFRPPFERDSFF